MTANELQKWQQQIQSQIAALQAKVARIEAKEGNNNTVSVNAPTGDGVNISSAQNQIDVYI